MRHKRLIWQLYPSQLLITIVALLVAAGYGAYSLRVFQLSQTAVDLEARARLSQEYVLTLLVKNDLPGLQSFFTTAGKDSGTRLTVTTPDGVVLADSDEDPGRMENHGDRPEIMAALDGKLTPSLRFSHTLQENMMYVAIPLMQEGKSKGILRTALPVTFINSALKEIFLKIAWGCLIVALLVALVAWFISRRISRPLEEMRLGAERFANGAFTGKLREEGAEEVASLARAMNAMADQLDGRIKTIARQHSQLEAVFSSMVEGVITVDTEERILDINQAGANLLNIPPEKLRGKKALVAVRNLALQQFVSQALASATPIEGEIDLTDRDGQEKYFYAHGTRFQDAAEMTSGAIIVINDVTNLRRLENMRRDFVANVSHELKTPITSIEGFAETLLDGALESPKDARRFVEIIAKQSKRLHAIIEDLLALSRLEQEDEQTELLLAEEKIVTPLRRAIETCSLKAAEKKISIELNAADNLTAKLNSPLLEQAVTNLIVNAIKYSDEGSRVLVRAQEREGETIAIEVQDFGAGVAAQHLPRLFERFYRSDAARNRKVGGTGLGLAIVKHIVQAHGGEVDVISEVGKGTTFTIQLRKEKGHENSTPA
ncbi:sensor histidine kinase [Thiovibrio frasassiensis]|jgi:two-component system phosphate regulon sensor histidine kinase PhoR|uniref:histidine kinase n=1 Tax=Thiovibrio frasassiensis TaxID=2984131 RepID=A0A9X4MET4_9BACT|nr:ATP-binding protein [Thiovibrio frasassiensis]MDG4476204.1 ATP-binding protein [Thiovibrio frasassiensis]